MVKRIHLIGIGMGEGTLTKEALEALERSEMIFGAPRMLKLQCVQDKLTEPIFESGKIGDRIRHTVYSDYAVLLSGDTGFYSGAKALIDELKDFSVNVYPGISSISYFFSKLQRPWQHAKLLSAHGRDVNLVDTVRRHAETFVLTGGNVHELAQKLIEADFGELSVYLGENLGGELEKVKKLSVKELPDEEVASLSVLFIENPHPDARVKTGISDELFHRGDVPMSKSPVRAQIMSKLDISPSDICFDIGAGTGSVSVEMALAAYEGRVYAIDREEKALELVRRNAGEFHLGNIVTVHGSAPDVLDDLPSPDVVFIGGCSGHIEETLKKCLQLNPRVRLVLSTIAVESMTEAWKAFQRVQLKPDILQLSSARSKAAGSLHLMMADNPVFIFSAGGRDE